MANEMDSNKPTDRPTKLPYKKPKFVELGTLRDLTATVGMNGNPDGGGMGSPNKTQL